MNNKKISLPRTPAAWLEAVMNFIFFLCGILAGNYDMKQLFIDGFLRLVKSDIADLEAFFARLDEITHRHGVDVVISVSAKDEETPEYLKKYIQD